MNPKPIWQSKVFYVNLLAFIAMIIQNVTGNDWLTPEYQMQLLAVINVILRFITKQPVTLV